eukprot:Sspe_Gene.13484::Locus_4612_Transcript_1_1_Confidence_1.000_Length_4750::g.13484::m.13484
MSSHIESVAAINKLVKTLGVAHLKELKESFLSSDDGKLDLDGFRAAVNHALSQWANDQVLHDDARGGWKGRETTPEKLLESVRPSFTPKALALLFSQLDGDDDGKVDWVDVSNFMVEGAIVKQTIKEFQERPEIKEWSDIEVDKMVYVQKWRKLVLCTQSKVVPVYTIKGTKYAEFEGHKSSVMNAVFLEAIDRLATSSSDSTVIIWDEKQRCILKQIPFAQPVLCMASVRYGATAYLYLGGLDKTVRGYSIDMLMEWEPPEKHIDEPEGQQPGVVLSETADDVGIRRVGTAHPTALGSRPRLRRRGDQPLGDNESDDTGEPPLGKGGRAATMSSSDDDHPRAGSIARMKRGRKRRGDGAGVWNTAGESRKYPVPTVKFSGKHGDWVTDILIIGDLRLVVSASLDKTVRVWDMGSGELRYKKVGHSKGVLHLCYIEEYRVLLSSGYGREVLVWNPFTPSPALASLTGHDKQLLGVTTFPNTPTCVSMDSTGRIIVWDIRNYSQSQALGGPMSKYNQSPATCFCLDPVKGHLLSVGKEFVMYRTKENAHVHKMKHPISFVLTSLPTQRVVLSSGGKLYVYHLLDGRLLSSFDRLSVSNITGVCWTSSSCNEVAVGNAEGRVKTINVESGDVVTLRSALHCGVAALYRLVHPPVRDKLVRPSRTEAKLLLMLSAKGQVVCVNHTKVTHERVILRHQTITGGLRSGYEVTLSCFSTECNFLVALGTPAEPTEGAKMSMEVWNLADVAEPIYAAEALDHQITACTMVDSQNCMLTCDTAGRLVFWNRANMARMVVLQLHPVSPETNAPFVGHSLIFNEDTLSVTLCDDRRVKVLSFADPAHHFFEVHRDALWNLVAVPAGSTHSELYRRRYIIEKELRGHSRVVRLGVDLRGNSRVAIKAYSDLQTLQKEIEVAEAVMKYTNGVGVCRVLDHWVENQGDGWLAVECADGSLWERIWGSSPVLSCTEKNHAIGCFTRGLGNLHYVGYVHTALTPRRVMLFDTMWKVTSLSQSRKIGETVPLSFTPHYCPPEMAQKRLSGGRLSAAPCYDMWCYGCIVYELVTGSRLFPFRTEDEVLAKLSTPCSAHIAERIADVEDKVYQKLLMHTLCLDPAHRKGVEWCAALLTEAGYMKDIQPPPVELRPFPSAVPQDLQPLRLTEPDEGLLHAPMDTAAHTDQDKDRGEGESTSDGPSKEADVVKDEHFVWGTRETRCVKITAMCTTEGAHCVLLADHDPHAGHAVLRLHSQRMRYLGRLPTNDYDDTDTNWKFPTISVSQGEPVKTDSPPPASAKAALPPLDMTAVHVRSETDQLATDLGDNTPRTLLKNNSWGTLHRRMEEVQKKQTGDTVGVVSTDALSPFFTEWKKLGVPHVPVQAFYQPTGKKSGEGSKVRTTANRQKHKSDEGKKRGADTTRDLEFIKSSPRPPGDLGQHVGEMRVRRRCHCGGGPADEGMRCVQRLMNVRIVKPEGGLFDTSLWVRPPRKALVAGRGGSPQWITEVDRMLGVQQASFCPRGHPLRRVRTTRPRMMCHTCRRTFPCCTPLLHCSQCDHNECLSCGDSKPGALSPPPPPSEGVSP